MNKDGTMTLEEIREWAERTGWRKDHLTDELIQKVFSSQQTDAEMIRLGIEPERIKELRCHQKEFGPLHARVFKNQDADFKNWLLGYYGTAQKAQQGLNASLSFQNGVTAFHTEGRDIGDREMYIHEEDEESTRAGQEEIAEAA